MYCQKLLYKDMDKEKLIGTKNIIENKIRDLKKINKKNSLCQ